MFLIEFSYTLFTKTQLLFCISLLSFIYRRVNTSQIFLGATTPVTLNKNQIKAIHFSSGKSVPLLKLSTSCPQEKSSHKKNHAYLTDSEYFTCLLKKRSRLQHISQSGHLQTCKTSRFFQLINFQQALLHRQLSSDDEHYSRYIL